VLSSEVKFGEDEEEVLESDACFGIGIEMVELCVVVAELEEEHVFSHDSNCMLIELDVRILRSERNSHGENIDR
jgi:hypothetical protein